MRHSRSNLIAGWPSRGARLPLVGLLLLTGASVAAAQNTTPPALQGTWVPAKATCESPSRVIVGPDRITLVNGKDTEVIAGAEMAGPGYWGPDYNGIMAVLITEFDGQQPVTMSFNVGEKKGVAQVEFAPAMPGGNPQQAAYNKRIGQLNLLKRFPLNKVLLKQCAAESGTGGAPRPTTVSAAAKPVAAGPSVCAGVAHCVEVTPFAATVTDFRNSNSGSTKVVTLNMRFQNRTAGPLVLGYVQGSGIVTDDQGNRYGVSGRGGVRGIGEITGNTFDPKFVLQPGEASDARFEFQWTPAQGQIFGTTYDVELALREIEPLAGNQYRLGKEYALKLDGFGTSKPAPVAAAGPAAGAPATGTAPTSSGATAAAPASTEPDACAGRTRCYNAGPFAAEVTQVAVAKASGYQVISVKVKVQNISGQPLILGFQSGSGTGSDDVGNRVGARDNRVKGIGLVTSGAADPQFGLNPGQARTFNIDYQLGIYRGTVLGSVWSVDFVLEQLEVLPSRQVRSVRDYAVSFTDLAPGNAPNAGGASTTTASAGGDAGTAPAATSDSSATNAVNATAGAVKAVGKLFKK